MTQNNEMSEVIEGVKSMNVDVIELEEYGKKVKKIILAAGELVKRRIPLGNEVETKSNFADLVTEVDKEVEAFLINNLKEINPSFLFLTEETNPNTKIENDLFYWVIDPIDGTMNFVHGYPRYSISVALCTGTEVLLGFVLDVVNDVLYSAILGKGAYRNGLPIQVSNTSSIESGLIAFGISAKQWDQKSSILDVVSNLIGNCRGIRITGSACLDFASVACGEFDGFWHYGIAPWDIAAGKLLVKEARGICTDLHNSSDCFHPDWVIATNGMIHEDLLKLLRLNNFSLK